MLKALGFTKGLEGYRKSPLIGDMASSLGVELEKVPEGEKVESRSRNNGSVPDYDELYTGEDMDIPEMEEPEVYGAFMYQGKNKRCKRDHTDPWGGIQR